MISGIGGSAGAVMFQRPDPAKMASQLFSKLDTKNQGYIEKSDLQTGLNQIGAGSGQNSGANADEIFKQLDGNSDGKVTAQEMTDSIKKLADQLETQLRSSGGMGGQRAGGPPPGPPPGGGPEGGGMSKDELTKQLSTIGSSDAKASSKISKLVENFSAADTNSDGKVSFQEAIAYDQKSNSETTSVDGNGVSTSPSNTQSQLSASVMQQIMQLMHSYGVIGQDDKSSSGNFSASA